MTPHAARDSRWLIAAGVAALLALHAGLALWAASRESVTADEILHVTGGYFYNRFGDYRIQPENGNLTQRWVALPAWLMQAPPPPLADNIYWRTSDQSVIGYQFFYETGHDHWPMLMAARAMTVLLSLGTGLLVFFWARRLAGTAAGFLALAFYALDPSVLAHAGLATSDIAAVFFLLAAVTAFWRHLGGPDWRSGALSAAVFGLACVAKYSTVLLLPVMLLLLVWRILAEPAGRRARWLKLAPLTLAAHGAAAVFIIWLFYGFRYSGFAADLPPADHFTVPWAEVLPYIGWPGRLVQFCRDGQLLPEAFLYGYSWVVQSARARSAFLAGEYGYFGWIRFFPLAFLWKSTLALLAALAVGAGALLHRWRNHAARRADDLSDVAPLLVLFGVYGIFSLASHLNIGHRHILPLYPVLFILVGGLAAPGLLAGGRRAALVALLIAGQLLAHAGVAPHYLAFFNSLAGGPANGHRLLVDSSLDWGQDLPGLALWLQESNRGATAQPVFLSYFGSGEPKYYGIKAVALPYVNGFKLPHPWYEPAAGIYCISATMLAQVYGAVPGPWTPEAEREYQQLRASEPLFRVYWSNPATWREVHDLGAAEAFEKMWRRYDALRLARLCHYLRARPPDAVVGFSIFIYRLTAAEVGAVLHGPYSELLATVEKVRRQD
ncbi:MAG: glycosyltransferase family 39 protein [Opitutae bacterium]|nr:glycosyltransferase family 39 protein [Opitutae bacterium]